MYRNSDIEKQLKNRYKGHMNRVNGAFFEYIIEGGCQYYRDKGIADIEKTPEPMRPIKDMGGGKFLAYFQKAAQPDFKGILIGGKAVVFEAKHTDTVKMDKTRVTSEQAQRLANAVKLGAEAFVLCSFGESGLFYRVPWTVWADMKALFGRKYVTAGDLKQYQIKVGGPGVLMFLEGLVNDEK